MRMDDQDESSNVEDARGAGGFGFRPIHGVGLGTLAIALIGGWMLGINPLTILGLLSGGGIQTAPPPAQQQVGAPAAEDPQIHFVRQVLRSTEVVWGHVFEQQGQTYQPPRMIVFRDRYPTGCGMGEAAAGPFYCPGDRRVYLDLGFFDLMTRQLGAPGQFAHAYVVAHEVGHHVQNLLGTLESVDARPEAGATGRSVRTELQADCYAGVWTHRSQQEQHGWRLEAGDIESALNAASQIGDDTLQRRSRGTVVPESFTHGTSSQRVAWFTRGYKTGDLRACDTFSGAI